MSLEVGKYYVFHGEKDDDLWNDEGYMDFVLLKRAFKCISSNGINAKFEMPNDLKDHYAEEQRQWNWGEGIKDFKEASLFEEE